MVQLLLFSAGEVSGGIPLADVSHVIRMVQISEKTGAFPWEVGSINLHGNAVPVISARVLFGAALSDPRLTDLLIIVRTGSGDVALWVDATSGVQDIPFIPPHSLEETARQDIPGIQNTPEGIRVIWDLLRLLTRGGSLPATKIQLKKKTHPYENTGISEEEDADSANTILSERAKRIARPKDTVSGISTIEILRFRLAYREYAIEMKHIREVVLTGDITPVPGTPDYISGICIVRGEIISLVDLRVLLAIPEKGLTDLNRVIVLENDKLTFGILADHITGIGTIELDRIAPPFANTFPVKGDYLKGIVGGSLMVLDTSAMFADPGMIIEDT